MQHEVSSHLHKVVFFFREGGVMTKIYMATILHIKVVKKETFQEIELGALNLTDGQFVTQIL